MRLARPLAMAAAAGLVLDIGLRGGVSNGIVTGGLSLIVIALLLDGVERPSAVWVAVLGLVPALCLLWRSSPWLTTANVAMVGFSISAAVAYARSGSVWDTTPARFVGRLLPLGGFDIRLPDAPLEPVRRLAAGRVKTVARVVIATVISVPVLGAVVALMASGDAVFAGMLAPPDVNLGPIAGHLVVTGVLAIAVLALVAMRRRTPRDEELPGLFGATEIVTMLGLATAVLALFVVSQLIALTSAGERLVEDAGLTPAEYARSGFFQLCWATALLVGFLAVARALARPQVLDLVAVRMMAAVVPLLTLGLVAVSLRRMALYDRAFGLTMLRLSVVVAAVWFGAVLVMIALRNLGVGGRRNWVMAGSAGVALLLALIGNIVNAESFVVRHNLDRAADGAELDVHYLARLSDDAVPALVEGGLAEAVDCDDQKIGAAAINVSVDEANQARDRVC